MTKYISLIFYYSILRFLPSNSTCKTCVRARRFFVKYIFNFVGCNVNIASGVRFGSGKKISIGNNSGIGENSYLVAMASITIGDDVMIAPEVMILTGGHEYNNPELLLRNHPSIAAPIKIGNDCWISARVIILPGVSITDRVIIAAGSIVTNSITESGIYGGNPARKIKDIPN
jgi:maltose O-acetyltransferase